VKKQRRFVVMEFGREEVEEGKKELKGFINVLCKMDGRFVGDGHLREERMETRMVAHPTRRFKALS
jgi:hypothetical protein